MKPNMPRFMKDESGAVTVDWVVLCAAIVGLAALIAGMMTTNSVNLSDLVSSFMTNWNFN